MSASLLCNIFAASSVVPTNRMTDTKDYHHTVRTVKIEDVDDDEEEDEEDDE